MAFLRTKTLTGQTFTTEYVIDGGTDPTFNDCDVVGGTFKAGVYIKGVANCRLNGADVTAPQGIGVYVEQAGSSDLEIANCYVHDCGKDGLYVNQGTATTAPRHVNLKLTTNRVVNVGTGVTGDTEVRNGITCYAADATIQGNTVDGVKAGDGIKSFSNAYIGGNTVRNVGAAGISVRPEVPPGGNPLRVTANSVSLIGKTVGAAPGVGVYSGATTKTVPGGIEIDNNTILVSPATPVLVQSPYTATVHDNILTSGGGGPVTPPPVIQPPKSGALGEPFATPGTVLIMKADGPPGSAQLVDDDAALRGKLVTLVGGAKMVSYGGAGRLAIRLDGALTSYVEVVHADMAFGTGDCAVELIVRPDAVVPGACLYDGRDGNLENGTALGLTASQISLLVGASTGSGGLGSTVAGQGAYPGLGKLAYVALGRVGGTMRLYAGLTTAAGVPQLVSVAVPLNATAGRARFGAGVRGLIVGVRVSKRTGRGLVNATVAPLGKFPVL